MGAALSGCGGSVDSDLHGSGGSAGAGGSGANSGSGGVGGGSGGSSASGGSAGVAGSGAVAGAGGSGGVPACCMYDTDCPQYFGGDDEGAPLTTRCVEGVCKEIPPPSNCWDDADCPMGHCEGASVCPCNMDCHAEDTLGWCVQPPQPYCCQVDFDCGDFAYMPCVNGVCKMPVPGACWKDEECPAGTQCVGATVCPCNALCGTIDTPGKCL